MSREIRRALLGDRAAQERITERGVMLPCPFCGASADDLTYFMGVHNSGFVCEKCRATQDGYFETYDEALASWNYRAHILSAEELERLEDSHDE